MERKIVINAGVFEDERSGILELSMGNKALGYLVALWLWCGRQYPKVNTEDLECGVIEMACGYRHINNKTRGDNAPGELCAALEEAGYLEKVQGEKDSRFRIVDFGRTVVVVEEKK